MIDKLRQQSVSQIRFWSVVQLPVIGRISVSRASAVALRTVLKTTEFAFTREHLNFGHPQNRDPSTNQDETLHAWLVAPKTPGAKIGGDRLAGDFLKNGWNITVKRVLSFYTFFSNSPTGESERPT